MTWLAPTFLINEKEEIARNRIIKDFENSQIQVLNGRFGPYISDGKLNGKIPKDREPASLTLEEAQQLLIDTGKPARKNFNTKKTATKNETRKQTTKKRTTDAKATKKVSDKPVKKQIKKRIAPNITE